MSLAAMTWQTLTSVGGAAAEDSVAVLRIHVPAGESAVVYGGEFGCFMEGPLLICSQAMLYKLREQLRRYRPQFGQPDAVRQA